MINTVAETGQQFVFVRNDHPVGRYFPVDIEQGVVIENPALAFFAIKIVTLVHHRGLLAQHRKTVCETSRDQQLLLIITFTVLEVLFFSYFIYLNLKSELLKRRKG